MVIVSCSGEGGAAIARRNYGETLAHMAAPTRFPYHFAGNYAKYANKVDEWPVDAHMLIAMIAPRPLLLQTGNTDKWSDPYGEFLAAVAAEPVYKLLGKKGLGTSKLPVPGEPILHDLGYLMHDGGHARAECFGRNRLPGAGAPKWAGLLRMNSTLFSACRRVVLCLKQSSITVRAGSAFFCTVGGFATTTCTNSSR